MAPSRPPISGLADISSDLARFAGTPAPDQAKFLAVLDAGLKETVKLVLLLPGEDAEQALRRHGIDRVQPGRLAALLPLKRETTT